jgi:hypothetical protein
VIETRPPRDRAEEAAFHALPARLQGAGWGPRLRWEERRLFAPATNGFLATHDVARFLAWRDGRAVGRIAACVPHDPAAPATFGFLAVEEDAAVLRALLDAARGFAAAHGRDALLGPLSFTINHEVGAQAGFFDRPPMLRMPATPPWLPAALDAAGLRPVKDVLACTVDLATERHRTRFARLAAARAPDMARLSIRGLRRADYAAEVRLVAALFDDAWADNWGAVPLGPAEVETLATLLRPLLWRGQVFIAAWDGKPVGLLSLVPNIDAALPRDGRLLPLGWARLPAALAGRIPAGADQARIPMLGITRAFRRHPASALAMGALLDAAFGLAARRGWRRIEISWILEDNAAMLNAMARLPAPVTGRWRLWAMPAHSPTEG